MATGINDRIINFPDIFFDDKNITSKKLNTNNFENFKSIEYELSFWDTGYYEVPSFNINVFNSINDTLGFIMPTDLIPINVLSLILNNDLSIKNLKEKESLPILVYRKLFFSIIAILILLLLIIWMLNKRESLVDNDSNFKKEKINPYLIAVKKIKLLKKEFPSTQKEAGTFYTNLSLIVKEFIENQFYIRAIEMTTYDLKNNKYLLGNNKKEINKIIKVLERADLIKFAKVFPSKNQFKTDLNNILDYLNGEKIEL